MKESLISAIGHTPLVKIGNLYAKLECMNPGGSSKDRAALAMILDAEAKGVLQTGGLRLRILQ